jgi:excinuclease ABC subunit C
MNNILHKLSLVPDKPGCYIMRDEGGQIIYIGKAKDLKKRLSSYFQKGAHDAKVTAMLTHVVDFDYFICASEKDALGLEANLIKKHKPHYNILLKDNKTFPYIKVVDGQFPYLEVTRKLNRGGKYFGPYFNGIWAKDLLNVIQDVFPVSTCGNSKFSAKTVREPCLNYQIGRCSAPCAGKISAENYGKIIEDVKAFLRGERDGGAREILTDKMQTASDLQQFELAIRYRDGLNFLDKLKERTITQIARDVNCDVFGSAILADIFVVSVLTVRAGKLIGVQNFANENREVETEDEMLSGFIMQYYTENSVPELIISKYELTEVAEALNCKIFNPKAALKKQLLEMADSNAMEYVNTSIEKIKFKNQFTVGACMELREILGLQYVPRKIECYDISNLFGEETVASMVTFIDGEAAPKLYRRFIIKSHSGIDDYKSMKEVLSRRLAKLGSADASFGIVPNLIVIDGGRGQLSSAGEALAAAEIPNGNTINMISLAERNEEIFLPDIPTPIILSRRSYALRLVQRIRDEAHRFAITFHKHRRDKKNAKQFKK